VECARRPAIGAARRMPAFITDDRPKYSLRRIKQAAATTTTTTTDSTRCLTAFVLSTSTSLEWPAYAESGRLGCRCRSRRAHPGSPLYACGAITDIDTIAIVKGACYPSRTQHAPTYQHISVVPPWRGWLGTHCFAPVGHRNVLRRRLYMDQAEGKSSVRMQHLFRRCQGSSSHSVWSPLLLAMSTPGTSLLILFMC
jgi:hypothetical protein